MPKTDSIDDLDRYYQLHPPKNFLFKSLPMSLSAARNPHKTHTASNAATLSPIILNPFLVVLKGASKRAFIYSHTKKKITHSALIEKIKINPPINPYTNNVSKHVPNF